MAGREVTTPSFRARSARGLSWCRTWLGFENLTLGKLAWRLLPSVLLAAALLLLRIQLVCDLGLDLRQAVRVGLVEGWTYDLLIVFMVATLADGVWTFTSTPRRATWIAGALFAWTATVANALYFRFFKVSLDWWIVKLHLHDVLAVKGSVTSLGNTKLLLGSTCLGAIAIVAALLPDLLKSPRPRQLPQPWLQTHRAGLRRFVTAVALIVVWWKLPFWLDSHHGTNILQEHVIRGWIQQNTRTHIYSGAGSTYGAQLLDGVGSLEQRHPDRILAAFRDRGTADETKTAETGGIMPEHASGLSRPLVAEPARTRSLRRRLGLPEEGPINVLFLFLESTRVFEVQHPALYPSIFPRTRALLDQHGIFFTQAYTSSFNAGQTARGKFSTLCSMLPNMLGPATFIAHPTVRTHCLQELFKHNGYTTAWMNSYKSTFHNARLFETLHGTEQFFDETYYLAHHVTQRIGAWGLADDPFLQQTEILLENLANQGKPVFAQALTISTHHPHTVIPEGALPKSLYEAARHEKNYPGYLSRLRYLDASLDNFFERFFASPLSERTLVIMMGDHSAPQAPHIPLTPVQTQEIHFRILLALISKNMPNPQRIMRQVHQADVAPTVAAIAGLNGTVNWVGRGLFAKEGTPWLYADGHSKINYRTADRACYAFPTETQLRCYDVAGRDPLFAASLTPIAEDPAQTAFFAQVARANMNAIALNRLLPPQASPLPLTH